jgi:RNA polymerase sigma-70 factor (ECF subfamily)
MAALNRRRSRYGRLEAFEQFVHQHQNTVYNVAYRILGDRELAAQVTRDTFSRSFPLFAEFRGASTRLWLMRLVTNVCHDLLRREPAAYQAASANGDVFQAHLNTLPLDQRIALVLSDVQGLSYREIAQVTGLSVGIVSSRLNRGRVALRDVLLAQGRLLPGVRP